MVDPRERLVCLLDYIKEQTKEVDPKGYRLTSSKGFLCRSGDIAACPVLSLTFALLETMFWLRVSRLAVETSRMTIALYGNLFTLIHLDQ